jgi:hypothetical protein
LEEKAMSDEDRPVQKPGEDKTVPVRDESGGARLVPEGNIVEGEFDVEAPGAPEPSP